MTETQVDGGSVEGTATDANGGASGSQSVQQPSLDAAKLQERYDALKRKMDEMEARTNGLQSKKDSEISSLKSQIAEYEKLKEKLGPEGALDQMELKQTLAEIKQQLSQTVSTPTPGNGQGGAIDAAKTFEEMGLDRSDPLVNIVLAGLQGKGKDAVELAGYRLLHQSAPTPTPAQGTPVEGKAPAPENVEAKTEQYKKDMLAARGNEGRLTKIREEAIANGVPVWSIDFS